MLTRKKASGLKEFFKVFLPLAILTVGVAVTLGLKQQELFQREIAEREESVVLLEREVMETDMAAHLSDALFLAELVAGHANALEDSDKSMGKLESELLAFAKTREKYAQVRYLSDEGKEVVRVNAGPTSVELVPAKALQNKEGRPYFWKTREAKGKLYVSKFDLNVENGKVQEPHQPMLRFATPVHDAQDHFLGVVVLNYLGEVLLKRLHQLTQKADGQLFLINSDGHWLIGPTPEHEWGMVLKKRDKFRFGSLFPNAWKHLNEKSQGQLRTENGLFTFAEVCPNSFQKDPDFIVEENWKVISHVPSHFLRPEWWFTVFSVCVSSLLVLAIIVGFWSTARARKLYAEEDLRVSETKLRTISDAARDAIFMVNSSGTVLHWNPAAKQMFGYAHDEVRGKKVHDFLLREDAIHHSNSGFWKTGENGQDLRDSGEGEVYEALAVKKKGGDLAVEVSIASVALGSEWCAVGIVRDISERKKMEKKLVRLATTDGLTGLWNRRYFLEKSTTELTRAKRYGHDLSVLVFDIDFFKKVNDTYGHDAGDCVLEQFSLLTGECMREMDILARMGGEEFAALLPETSQTAAEQAAERVRSAIESATFNCCGHELKITVSIGVAILSSTTPDLDAMLKAGDKALYEAKDRGRNCIVVL